MCLLCGYICLKKYVIRIDSFPSGALYYNSNLLKHKVGPWPIKINFKLKKEIRKLALIKEDNGKILSKLCRTSKIPLQGNGIVAISKNGSKMKVYTLKVIDTQKLVDSLKGSCFFKPF